MIDRQMLETILQRRFPGAPLDQIAAAANAIMALDEQVHDDCRETGGMSVDPRKTAQSPAAPNVPVARS